MRAILSRHEQKENKGMRFILTLVAAALLATDVTASDLKGKVKDAKTGEELIGAAVFVKEYPTIGGKR